MIRRCPVCGGSGCYMSEGQLLDHTFEAVEGNCDTCSGHGFRADSKEEFDAEVEKQRKQLAKRVEKVMKDNVKRGLIK
jgi:excinuclease UvrABC ATPase subunit